MDTHGPDPIPAHALSEGADGLSEAAQASVAVDPQVADALSQAQRWVGGPVWGVGVGADDDGTPCITVLAEPGTQVPPSVAGIAVRTLETGPVQATEHRTGPDDQGITARPAP